MISRTSLASAFGAFLLLALALHSGCSEGRFPVCKTNADCEARDAGPDANNICFAQRCVECRYDTDCPVGSVCTSSQSCDSISDTPAASAQKEEPAPTWDPAPQSSAAGKGPKKPGGRRSGPKKP
jgi:hypothetical protein